MRFARSVFLIAGIYGVLVLSPLYFLEGTIAKSAPPAITHPEYFYGWVSAALVFQVMFLIISRDPARFRPIMVVAMLEKFTWIVAIWTLAGLGRLSGGPLYVGSIDLVWGVLFALAYVRTRPSSPTGSEDGLQAR